MDNTSTPKPTNPLSGGFSVEPESRDERRKALVRQTWRSIEFDKSAQFTQVFYKKLFERYPEVQPMFANCISLEAQAKKLYEVICVAVRFLDNLGELVPVLQELGVRHAVSYNVKREHYAVVNEIFVETLYDFLYALWPNGGSTGSTSVFLLDVSDSWSWVLTLVGSIMADAGAAATQTTTSKEVVSVITLPESAPETLDKTKVATSPSSSGAEE